jgi:HTH-type transcriptional regulator, sugar sensing transcriptional regulator
MDEQIKMLTSIGLTDKQAIVYNALLELGEAKMTHIARHARLKRPTVYLVIEELMALALVSLVEKGKKKIYSAVHPNRINEILDSRKQQFTELLPTLLARYGSIRGKPKVQMLEGMEGIRTAYQEAYALLKEGKNEGLWFGNISFLLEHFPQVIKEYDAVLDSLKKYEIRELITGGEASRAWVEKMQRNPKPYHQIKYLNDNGACGITDQLIVGNKLMLFSMNTELFTLIIESEEITKTQRFLFDQLWKGI